MSTLKSCSPLTWDVGATPLGNSPHKLHEWAGGAPVDSNWAIDFALIVGENGWLLKPTRAWFHRNYPQEDILAASRDANGVRAVVSEPDVEAGVSLLRQAVD